MQITTVITAGVTANPITIEHVGILNPTIILRTPSGANYNGVANNVDNGTTIVLTGDDDGSGHFRDSFTVILKGDVTNDPAPDANPTYALPADFIGEFNIPNKDIVGENLQWFINKYEPQLPVDGVPLYVSGLLPELMGKDLYAAYVANPTEQRFVDLVLPFFKPASICYCYFWYLKDQSIQNLDTGAAQSKKKNAVTVSPYPKMVRSWNEMVKICRKFHKYMKDNATTYPEYSVNFPEWFYGWGFWDGVWMTWFFDVSGDNYWHDWGCLPQIYRFENTLGI